ncbi:hypothetical protein CDCA_CDCA07G2178 [Cyanidium caldarium]|uniref:Adenylosuccinate synthetase n=1 Tax=Cyanidium caldarium TaxID=2771 RepID=A0AAV9IVP6_CYACA|nr:hypothetical protein CDCA_CDCA07G2178 [Cyanidium caldarium]
MPVAANGPSLARSYPLPATVVLGTQWGDEGKGKLVDLLSESIDVVARCQGGSNAGHTVVVNGVKYALHLLPTGILHPAVQAVIGNGVVVHLASLFEEVETLELQGVPNVAGRVHLSDRAHILCDYHQIADGLLEAERVAAAAGGVGGAIGTTKRGIGPCYASKMTRSNLRVGDLREFRSAQVPLRIRTALAELRLRFGAAGEAAVASYDVRAEVARCYQLARRCEPLTTDTFDYVNRVLESGQQSVLIEGANAAMLDIDFGTYPFVTSSNCTVGGCCTGLGVPARALGEVIGVVKAYTTRVGEGPFPTELYGEAGALLQRAGQEFGTTTQRPRRCGWLDTCLLRYTGRLNGLTQVCLTKLDVLGCFDTLRIGVAYRYRGKRLSSMPASLRALAECEVEFEELPGWRGVELGSVRCWSDLPAAAQAYVLRVQTLIGCPIVHVGVGAAREAIFLRSAADAVVKMDESMR